MCCRATKSELCFHLYAYFNEQSFENSEMLDFQRISSKLWSTCKNIVGTNFIIFHVRFNCVYIYTFFEIINFLNSNYKFQKKTVISIQLVRGKEQINEILADLKNIKANVSEFKAPERHARKLNLYTNVFGFLMLFLDILFNFQSFKNINFVKIIGKVDGKFMLHIRNQWLVSKSHR